MKIALVVAGTRGDVQPFVCLGRALADAGEDVEIVAPLNGERMIRAANLSFRPFPLDAQELLNSESAQRMLADGHVRRFFRWIEQAEKPYWDETRRVLIESGMEADIMVCGAMMIARCGAVAEAMGVPMVPLHLCPIAPSRSYISALLPQRSLGPLNRLAHYVPLRAFYESQREDLARLHAELDLSPPTWRGWCGRFSASAPGLLGYSQTLFPLPEDWSGAVHPAGFLDPWPQLRAKLGEVGIPDPLEAWLSAGPPPVFFGFGSMPVLDGQAMLATIRSVAAELGKRAIVAAGWSEVNSVASEDFFVLDTVDHQSLLPRCAAAVHHGGAGTTTASAGAGIPTLVCSVLGDQPFWGERCRALGIGGTIPFRKLGARRLTHELRRVLDPSVRVRAGQVSRRMATEDGVGMALAYIERVSVEFAGRRKVRRPSTMTARGPARSFGSR